LLKLVDVYTKLGGFQVINGISLEINQGEIVALLGGNGAGKSSLFRTIAGVLPPYRGTIVFKGAAMHRLSADQVVASGLALCPEGRRLFPHLTVHKNLLLGAYVRRKKKDQVRQSLEQVFELFPLLRDRQKQLAGTFSGGQQQMLAIGRALMARPELILLDEPSMGLAPLVVEHIAQAIQAINRLGTTVFLSEQNAQMALMITQRGYVLENGGLVLEGTSAELLKNEQVKRAYLGI
jgi:branched-chain amino acid transport system ATP-binding protein